MTDNPSDFDPLTPENISNRDVQQLIRATISACNGDRFKFMRLFAAQIGGVSLFEASLSQALEQPDAIVESHFISIDEELSELNCEAWEREFADGNHYDWLYAEIRKIQAKLCPKKEGDGDPKDSCKKDLKSSGKEVRTVHYKRKMTTREILIDFEKRGLRLATFEEIHALRKTKPKLQREYHIVALGSKVPYPSKNIVSVPILFGGPSFLGMNLYCYDPEFTLWPEDFRFLGVPIETPVDSVAT